MGAGRRADGRADRAGAGRVREDGLGGAGGGPLRMVRGAAPRAGGWRARACADGVLRPGDGAEPEHRAAGLAAHLRPAARLAERGARVGAAGRSGAAAHAAAGVEGTPGGGASAGGPAGGPGAAGADREAPGGAGGGRGGAQPGGSGGSPAGSRSGGAPAGQELPHGARPGERAEVAAEGRHV